MFISLDDEMSPSEIPKDKKVKYSGTKRENSNLLIEKFFEMIKHDRYYAKKLHCGLLKFLELDMPFFIILIYLIRIVVV